MFDPLTWFRAQAMPRPFDATPLTGWRGVVWSRGLRGNGFSAVWWAITAAIGIGVVGLSVASGDWALAAALALLWIPLVSFSIARLIRAVREDNEIGFERSCCRPAASGYANRL